MLTPSSNKNGAASRIRPGEYLSGQVHYRPFSKIIQSPATPCIKQTLPQAHKPRAALLEFNNQRSKSTMLAYDLQAMSDLPQRRVINF
jgi:hypothetical protein